MDKMALWVTISVMVFSSHVFKRFDDQSFTELLGAVGNKCTVYSTLGSMSTE